MRFLQRNPFVLPSVEGKKRGVFEKKSAVFLDFLSLWGHILPYIYRDASQREPAGRSTRAETSTPHPNLGWLAGDSMKNTYTYTHTPTEAQIAIVNPSQEVEVAFKLRS